MRHEALALTARGGEVRQDPCQVINSGDLQQLVGTRDRLDHLRTPAGVREGRCTSSSLGHFLSVGFRA